MIDIQDRWYCPSLEEIAGYINNPVFLQFCTDIKTKYNCTEKIEFSSCKMEFGWNIKFKKSGKSLCTIYPRERYFTILIVIGDKQREPVESILSACTEEMKCIYSETKTGNGQKWLMIDLKEVGRLYSDIARLIDIRRKYWSAHRHSSHSGSVPLNYVLRTVLLWALNVLRGV